MLRRQPHDLTAPSTDQHWPKATRERSCAVPTAPSYDNLAARAADLCQHRREAELNLAGAVLADHQPLVRVAADASVRKCHFDNLDVLLIYNATVAGRNQDRRHLLREVMFRLQEGHYWDSRQIEANLGQMLWSCESLVALASSWFPSPSIVTHFAKQLICLFERQRDALLAYGQCIRLLSGNVVDETCPRHSDNRVLPTVHASTGTTEYRRAA